MAEKSLEERVSAIEAQLAGKTLEEHFSEQAELIDRRFAESFGEQAELIDKLFIYRFDEWDKRWDAKLDAKLEPIRTDLTAVKDGVKIILARLP